MSPGACGLDLKTESISQRGITDVTGPASPPLLTSEPFRRGRVLSWWSSAHSHSLSKSDDCDVRNLWTLSVLLIGRASVPRFGNGWNICCIPAESRSVSVLCQPSIFYLLSGVRSRGRRTDVPLPSHLSQLFRGHLRAFPGLPNDLVTPKCPGSSRGLLPVSNWSIIK